MTEPKRLTLSFDLVGTPWGHQLRAMEIAKDRRDFALFFEPGCGKTYTAILLARWKMKRIERPMRTLEIGRAHV